MEVGDHLYHPPGNELFDELVTQALDVHRTPRCKMDERAFELRGTNEPRNAPMRGFAAYGLQPFVRPVFVPQSGQPRNTLRDRPKKQEVDSARCVPICW